MYMNCYARHCRKENLHELPYKDIVKKIINMYWHTKTSCEEFALIATPFICTVLLFLKNEIQLIKIYMKCQTKTK